jgi:hypothetical protein
MSLPMMLAIDTIRPDQIGASAEIWAPVRRWDADKRGLVKREIPFLRFTSSVPSSNGANLRRLPTWQAREAVSSSCFRIRRISASAGTWTSAKGLHHELQQAPLGSQAREKECPNA